MNIYVCIYIHFRGKKVDYLEARAETHTNSLDGFDAGLDANWTSRQ